MINKLVYFVFYHVFYFFSSFSWPDVDLPKPHRSQSHGIMETGPTINLHHYIVQKWGASYPQLHHPILWELERVSSPTLCPCLSRAVYLVVIVSTSIVLCKCHWFERNVPCSDFKFVICLLPNVIFFCLSYVHVDSFKRLYLLVIVCSSFVVLHVEDKRGMFNKCVGAQENLSQLPKVDFMLEPLKVEK